MLQKLKSAGVTQQNSPKHEKQVSLQVRRDGVCTMKFSNEKSASTVNYVLTEFSLPYNETFVAYIFNYKTIEKFQDVSRLGCDISYS
jgi:hypothetical protein